MQLEPSVAALHALFPNMCGHASVTLGLGLVDVLLTPRLGRGVGGVFAKDMGERPFLSMAILFFIASPRLALKFASSSARPVAP